uniref:Uncharacterized protein n=1 Tax=Leersia perrieri TaxID=77586 RepID=A0A0D9XQH5_9ORYZ
MDNNTKAEVAGWRGIERSNTGTGNGGGGGSGSDLCKRDENLDKGSVHLSSAHQVFDGMSSLLQLFEEDIPLVMKENISRDEARYLLQEELRKMYGVVGGKSSKV